VDKDLPEPEDAPEVPDDAPTAKVDAEVERAPGGADASMMESDVGAGEADELATPDQPLSAQTDEVDVPDALKEGEDTDDKPESESTDPEDSEPA